MGFFIDLFTCMRGGVHVFPKCLFVYRVASSGTMFNYGQYGVLCVFLACVFTDFIKQSFASKYHPLITLRKNWKKSMLQDMDWISERSELFCCCPRNEI